MLSIQNLTCYYGVIRALNNVSLTIPGNGIYAVIGANGAGKSTLISAVAGLVTPTDGSVVFDGTDLTALSTKDVIRHGVALCPEGRRIFKNLTVMENLMSGAYTMNDKKIIEQNWKDVFALFPRLKEREKQLAGTLSGGEQQMLAIGRALMTNPKLLLLDEPSMGLAPNLVDLVFDVIVQIQSERNIPIILVEQNSEMALSVAKYAYVLEVGNLTLEGEGQQLLSNDEVRNKYLGV